MASSLEKIAFFSALLQAGGMAGKMLGAHALFGGVMPGAIEGMSTEGSFKDKIGAGLKKGVRTFINPREAVGTFVGYNMIPAAGAKMLGAAGKTMQAGGKASRFGKFLSGMEKHPGGGFFNKYVMGNKAGLVPNLVVGSTIGEPMTRKMTGANAADSYDSLLMSGR